MTEVRVTNDRTGGAKGSKPEAMALLPWDALLEVAKVYGFGAGKYEPNNWRRGYDWSLSFSAMQRHLAAFWCGQERDEESGLPHLAHAAFHVFALLVFSGQDQYADMDDRPPVYTAKTTLERLAEAVGLPLEYLPDEEDEAFADAERLALLRLGAKATTASTPSTAASILPEAPARCYIAGMVSSCPVPSCHTEGCMVSR